MKTPVPPGPPFESPECERAPASLSSPPPEVPVPLRRTGSDNPRPGGRSERVVREVLCATAKELARVGYVALRIEDVAAFARVNKTTIYRRWPTKPDLVSAAIRELDAGATDPPDTGTLRGDALAVVREIAARARTPEGRGVARMIMAELDNPEVEAIANALREKHQERWLAILKRGIARGELPRDADLVLIMQMLSSPVVHRVYRLRQPATAQFLEAVVSIVLAGASAVRAPAA